MPGGTIGLLALADAAGEHSCPSGPHTNDRVGRLLGTKPSEPQRSATHWAPIMSKAEGVEEPITRSYTLSTRQTRPRRLHPATGAFAAPEDALDTAGGLYLGDPTD